MDRITRVLALLLWSHGCGCNFGGSGAADAAGGGSDAGDVDADVTDASTIDAGPMSIDASTIDAGPTPIDATVLPPANDVCANATTISLATMHSDLATTTAGATADLAAPCAAAGEPDVFFTFTLTRRELVYADSFGASANTALYFATTCATALAASTTAGDAVCSSGACGTGQSQVTALLSPGTYYLVLAGRGPATIHFRHAEVGTGSVAPLAQGSSAPSGTTSGTGELFTCDAAGAENAYWWRTCPADPGGAFRTSASTGSLTSRSALAQAPISSRPTAATAPPAWCSMPRSCSPRTAARTPTS